MQRLVDLLNFSLEGPDADTRNQSQEVKIFDTLVESLAIAKSLEKYLALNHTVTADNHNRIDEVGE